MSPQNQKLRKTLTVLLTVQCVALLASSLIVLALGVDDGTYLALIPGTVFLLLSVVSIPTSIVYTVLVLLGKTVFDKRVATRLGSMLAVYVLGLGLAGLLSVLR